MKYLAASIVFALIVLAWMFQWQYSDSQFQRVNRFTGEVQVLCPDTDTHLPETECRYYNVK